MEDYSLVEADFQQYYHIDLEKYTKNRNIGFLRYSRLFFNLPKEARVVVKYAPGANWSYSESALSLVLYRLDVMMTMYINANRKKGAAAQKPPKIEDRYLPDPIRALELEAREQERKKNEITGADAVGIADFWKARNPDATYLPN